MISTSIVFSPDASIDRNPSDVIIAAGDAVLFYVREARILPSSTNGFNSHLPVAPPVTQKTSESESVIHLPESSAVINIMLHCVYGLPCTHITPTVKDIQATFAAMKTYGLPYQSYAESGAPLHHTIRTLIPTSPLDVYALAASMDNRDLATIASSHLLSSPLSNMSEEMSIKIGPVYLRRLFFLHLGRAQALKRLLIIPPDLHQPTNACTVTMQVAIFRRWALAAVQLAWDDSPNISPSLIESTFSPIGDDITCNLCKESLLRRISEVVRRWGQVKVFNLLLLCITIFHNRLFKKGYNISKNKMNLFCTTILPQLETSW